MSEAAILKVPKPLPATRTDLLAQYKLKRHRNINDLVEEVVVKLWDNDAKFMRYVDAIYDSAAVEGSLDDDDTMAALMIRDRAGKDNHVEVAAQNVRTIKLAMRVVLRRFGIDRPTREAEGIPLVPPQSSLSAPDPVLPAA